MVVVMVRVVRGAGPRPSPCDRSSVTIGAVHFALASGQCFPRAVGHMKVPSKSLTMASGLNAQPLVLGCMGMIRTVVGLLTTLPRQKHFYGSDGRNQIQFGQCLKRAVGHVTVHGRSLTLASGLHALPAAPGPHVHDLHNCGTAKHTAKGNSHLQKQLEQPSLIGQVFPASHWSRDCLRLPLLLSVPRSCWLQRLLLPPL